MEVIGEGRCIEREKGVVELGHRGVGHVTLRLQLAAALQPASGDEPRRPVGLELHCVRSVRDLRRQDCELGGLLGIARITRALRDAEPGKAEKRGERHRENRNELPTHLHLRTLTPVLRLVRPPRRGD